MNRTKKFLLNILLPLFVGIVVFAVWLVSYKPQREKITASAESSIASFTAGASIGASMATADQMRFKLNISDPSQVKEITVKVDPYQDCSFVGDYFYSMTSSGTAKLYSDSTTESYMIPLHVNPQIEYKIIATIVKNNNTEETVESDKRSVAYVLSKMKEAGDPKYENASNLHKSYMESVTSLYEMGSAKCFTINPSASMLYDDGSVNISISLTDSDVALLKSEENTTTKEELLDDPIYRKYENLSLDESYALSNGLQATFLPFYRTYVETTVHKQHNLYIIAELGNSWYGSTGAGLAASPWKALFYDPNHSNNLSLIYEGGGWNYMWHPDVNLLSLSFPGTAITNAATVNYYAMIVEEIVTTYRWQRYDIKWGKDNVLKKDELMGRTYAYNALKFSENNLSVSKKSWANEILSESDLSTMSESQLHGYQRIAGTYTSDIEIPVTVKYKSLVGDNRYITDISKVFNVNSLYARNMKSVTETMYALGLFNNLSDFNVVRKSSYFDKNDLERQTGDRIVQQATGYTYEYDSSSQKGTLTIEYAPFRYKDVMITIQSNDVESHLTKDFYTANATQTSDQIKLVFDYADLEMWGKNNCGWLFNLKANNFSIVNNSNDKVMVKNDGSARKLTLTCAPQDENALGEISIQAVSEIVEDVPYTMTYKYKIIEDSAGNLTESIKQSSPEQKMYSDLLAMSYGNFMTEYRSKIIENLLPATLADTNYCSPKSFQKTYDTENHTCQITVLYEYRSIFKVTDNHDLNWYKFMPTSDTTLLYDGVHFYDHGYDGYRISKIESLNPNYAKVTLPERADDWKNSRITVLCQASDGYIIPLKFTYTDKYKVRIEHLQNYLCATKDGKQEASGVAEKKITEKEVKIDSFADIYSPTTDELKNFLGFKDLRVIGKFGAPDLEKTVVTFSDDIYTIKLSYAYAAVKVQQADGSYEEVKVPMSSYAEWTNSFGKDWSVLFLNTTEKVIFTDTASVKPENVYGYFFVSVFKEKVKNLDMLFAGYASDGCKTFYQYEEVKGSAFYKFMGNNPYLLPVVGGAVGGITGLILGHPIKGTAGGAAVGAGVYYSIMSISEMANDENGTYYSYFSFLDGTSELPYASNSRAGGFDDNDSAAKNTVEKIADEVKDFFKNLWNSDNAITRFLKIVLGLFALYVIFSIVLKIIATIINFFRRLKK